MGMVANTDIPPGKLILEEKPLLSVPLTAAGDLPGRVRINQLIHLEIVAYMMIIHMNKYWLINDEFPF